MYLEDIYTVPTSLAGLPGSIYPLRFRRRTADRIAIDRKLTLVPTPESGPPVSAAYRIGTHDALMSPASWLPRNNTQEILMQWEVVLILEGARSISPQSKIFSGASIAFGAEPNTQACAVDLAMPGMLPVFNEEAFKYGHQIWLLSH